MSERESKRERPFEGFGRWATVDHRITTCFFIFKLSVPKRGREFEKWGGENPIPQNKYFICLTKMIVFILSNFYRSFWIIVFV